MHTYDKTYLASLGFRDPDKSNSLHDLAGQYLGEQAVGERLAAVFNPYPAADPNPDVFEVSNRCYGGAVLELPLMKGTGQYQTYVGFIDACLGWSCQGVEDRSNPNKRASRRYWKWVYVEVKINPVPVGDVLRQIALYRIFVQESLTHRKEASWALVTHYGIDAHEVKILKDNDITHIRLGDDFDRYCEWRRQDNAPSEDTVQL